MIKSDKGKKVFGAIVILAIIVSVFGGVVSAVDLSGKGVTQSVTDVEIQTAVGNPDSEELAEALDAVTDDTVNIEFADQSLLLGYVSAASLTVPSFKQCDSRWGANQLGTCSDTICSAGCAVTSVAMILKYYGVATDPGDLNTWLTKNSGYASGCLIIWDKADDRSGGSVQYAGRYDSNIPNQVQWEIDHGYPCVGGLDGHFVVITGYSDSLYYINDPSYSRSTISKSSITKIHTYHGTASGSCTAKFSKGDIVEVNTPGSCLKCYPDGPTSGTPKCEPHGTVGVILDPTPTLAADYCRVKVRYCDGFEGWSAQEYLEGKYIAPSTKFSIGDPVRASTGVKYRSDPPELNELGAVSQGTQGNILAGPKYGAVKDVSGCYWFWKIDYGGGKVGWSAQDYLEKVTPCPHSCRDRSALSGNELAALVRNHFPLGGVTQTGESIRVVAYAIAKAESGGNPSACGDPPNQDYDHSNSIGLWQIHAPSHPEYDKCRLFEEDYNANAATEISNNGQDWTWWCTYSDGTHCNPYTGTYANHLEEARKHFYPKVNSLSVSSTSISSDETVKIYYSVSDDVGLNRVELWRAIDVNGDGQLDWPQYPEDVKPASGQSASDYFEDKPTSPDVYWYGIHVVDNSGAPEAWNDEKNSRTGNWPGVYGPKKVEVTQPNQPPQVTTNAATLVEEITATLNGVINSDGGEACQYRFEYDINSGEPYAYNTGWTGSKTTGQSFNAAIPSLNKGTKYYFRAQAKNSAGTASGSELTFLTKPDAPTSFSATTAGTTQIDLSWTKGAGAQKTKIQRKQGSYPANRNDGTQVYFGTGTSTSDTGLTEGTTFYYRAWSYVQGSEQWSDNHAQDWATTTSIGAPTVTTNAATLVEETTATFNGVISSDGGEACQYRFEYDTNSGEPYAYNTGWTGSKTTGQSFNAAIPSLVKGTKYYFRAQAKNSAGTASGSELTVLTKPDAPSSFSATTAGTTQIDLSWTKGAGAQKTKIQRKEGGYPIDRNDGTQVYFGTGSSTPDTGLIPDTTYYYRAWSYVQGSEQWSDNHAQDWATTTSIGAPTVTTNAASGVGTTSATLNGNLDDTGGETCQVWFEYGKTTSYGSSTSPESKSSTGSFSKGISSLDEDTTYHFRAVASNSKGTVYGLDNTFKTEKEINPPQVTTNAASSIGTTSATLNGILDGTGGETCQVWFEYGKTTSYGYSTPKQSKSSTGLFSKGLSGLDDDTTYHFRAVASNSKGTVYGLSYTFKTKKETYPELSYSPTSHDFGNKCEGVTDSTTFEIWNSGTDTLTYSLSETCSWMEVNPTSGSSTGGHNSITVDIDTTGLSEDSHTCEITISSNDGSGTFTVTVNVVSCSCGNMGVNPTSWSPPTLNCGDLDSKIVTVSATGGVVEGVTASKISGETWLTLSQTNLGDISSSSSETFTMTAAPPAGTSSDDYPYTIRVSNTCGTPSTRDVSGTINVNENAEGQTDYWAVIVGVADYTGTLYDLAYTDDDAIDMYNTLLLSDHWQADHIMLLLDSEADKAGILAAFNWLDDNEDPEDVVLFFFSGHGTYGPDDDGDELDGYDEFICPYDFNNIRDDELDAELDRLESTSIVVIIDSCFAGGMTKAPDRSVKTISKQKVELTDGFAKDIQSTGKDMGDAGRVVLMACDDDEGSWETGVLENGVFSYYVVEGLEGLADAEGNGDGICSAEETFAYASPRAVAYESPTTQHPQLYDGYPGELPITRPFGISECDGTATSCGIYPNCENCNEQDGCYPYLGTGCEERDYYCVSNEAGCDYTSSNRHTDYYDDWDYYCDGDTVRKHRLWHNYYCDGGTCTDHTRMEDDQLVENCNDHDGWVDTGNTDWVEVNDCQEKEQKEQKYRDYSCSGGACTYSVTGTPRWIDTGTMQNKPEGTICGCTASNTLKRCDGGVCTDTGICDETTCGADATCDGKRPGDSCGGGRTCDSNCKCGAVGEDYAVFSAPLWFVDKNGDHVADDVFGYGFAGATPLVGDFNQDGADDIAVFCDGVWFVDTNGDHIADDVFGYGFAGATPLVGDINQDGTDDIAVFNDGVWFVDTNGDHIADDVFGYGFAGATPLVGDINQDGTDDIAVFNDGVWFVDTNGDHLADDVFGYGFAGATPLVGDINQDGTDDIAVFSAPLWFVDTNGDHIADDVFGYGFAGATPIVGNFG